MTTILRIPKDIHSQLLADLQRPHEFALERVAFCGITLGNKNGGAKLALATDWWPVTDDQYVDDSTSGARIGSQAIRSAMQRILDTGRGLMHVHFHDWEGRPSYSRMDRREIPQLVKSFRSTNRQLPHGMLVLSRDSATASLWLPDAETLTDVDQVSIVGRPTKIIKDLRARKIARFGRQSFLGAASSQTLEGATIGIVGLGGGGSHIAQQLAHLGIGNFVLYDEQRIEDSNLNRLIGGTEENVKTKTYKVDIAARLIHGINGHARVQPIKHRWQEDPDLLRSCDIVVGCVDRFDERLQLEISCRRYLMPYVDIGMDVHQVEGQAPRLVGQVIVSVPGRPCLQCMGFLNPGTLAREAQRYGDAGDQPQVVWSNGVLASTAVGMVIQLLTDWSGDSPQPPYLSYDGNNNTLVPHVRLQYLPPGRCRHHSSTNVGDPTI